MRLLVLQAIAISALYQAAWAYGGDLWDLGPEEQLALEQVLAEAYYPEAYYNPVARNEDPDTNKPVIPPNTSVQGGAGEGKQHLGPNLIPNKPRIVPEINPPVYDNPPNPCSVQDHKTFTRNIASQDKAAIGITCLCADEWDKEEVDCAEAKKCCIPNMPNEAEFVKQFQEASQHPDDDNDIFQNIGYSKRTHYYNGEKRAGHVAKKAPLFKRSSYVGGGMAGFRPKSKLMKKDHRNRYFEGPMKKNVVAKKSPGLSGGRLPIM